MLNMMLSTLMLIDKCLSRAHKRRNVCLYSLPFSSIFCNKVFSGECAPTPAFHVTVHSVVCFPRSSTPGLDN